MLGALLVSSFEGGLLRDAAMILAGHPIPLHLPAERWWGPPRACTDRGGLCHLFLYLFLFCFNFSLTSLWAGFQTYFSFFLSPEVKKPRHELCERRAAFLPVHVRSAG